MYSLLEIDPDTSMLATYFYHYESLRSLHYTVHLHPTASTLERDHYGVGVAVLAELHDAAHVPVPTQRAIGDRALSVDGGRHH